MKVRSPFNFNNLFGIFLLLGIFTPPAIFAHAGDLDPAFNRGKGYSVEALDSGGRVTASAMQPDGKIVIAGYGDHGLSSAFSAVRFNVDGSIDNTFGYNGRALTSFGGRIYDQAGVAGASARDVVIQPDGKILLMGNVTYYSEPHGSADFEVALVRLNADGSPDTTFDGDGKIRIPQGSLSFQRASAVSVMPDGKIEVFGVVFSARGTGGGLLRLNSDGSPDKSFGKDGLVVYEELLGYAMLVLSDGKTVIAGEGRRPDGSTSEFCTFRINYNGEFDTTFNGTGFAPVPHGTGWNYAENLLLQPDGKILVEGRWNNYTAMMRYNPDGTFDNSFGEFGFAYSRRDSGYGTAAALRPDGKIVIASSTGMGGYTPDQTINLWLFRFDQNGAPDLTFNGTGELFSTIRKTDEIATGIHLRPDGKVVVTGYNDQRKAIAVQFVPDGSRDPSFGTSGMVSSPIGYAREEIRDMAVLPDNKIVAVGQNALVRYMPNGEADLSFGLAGRGIKVGDSNTNINKLALRYDGKIVLAGQRGVSPVGTNDTDALLAMYNPDGTIDTNFGTSGKISVPFGPASHDTFQDVTILPNGKLVAVGYRQTQNPSTSDAVVARFNADGSLDRSFGKNGLVITHPCSSGLNAGVSAAAVQLDGKIVASGICGKLAIFRFNEDGSPDLTFGGSGIVNVPGTSYGWANDIKLQPDGSIVVAGYAEGPYFGNSDFMVARLLTDGSPDFSFNGSGLALVRFGSQNGAANSLEIQPDGKILAAGKGSDSGAAEFKILRFNSNGILDTTFWGRNGIVTLGFDGESYVNSVAIDANGRVLAGGSSGGLFGIVRLHGDYSLFAPDPVSDRKSGLGASKRD